MTEIKVKPLFKEAEKVIADYKEEAKKLDNQERELEAESSVLHEEMTANLTEQENADVGTLVYLKIQAKEINQKAEIIAVLLEELKQERTQLKLKYVPLYRQALAKSPYPEYEATEIVERYKYQMLKEISEIGKQMRTQYYEIAPDLEEIFHDKGVLEQFPRLAYTHTYDSYKPKFNWFNNSVISKSDVLTACDGSLPQGLKQPKDVK
ncbi:Phage protein [Priestia megaterium]|uniref:hypothetical protein n=1 Tax=Priestia megaterium TaxID=1404 RepID=UPI002E1ECF12|nr:hypothetical protein [Priestia megaterium]